MIPRNIKFSTVPSKKHYDFILVGGGSSGALLANRLSKFFPSKSVLLLESGSPTRYHLMNPVIHVPLGYLLSIGNPYVDYCLNTEKDPNLNNRSLKYPRGNGLGGCSQINGMLYQRPTIRDINIWGKLSKNTELWNWERCLEKMKLHEKHYSGDNEFHSSKGEFPVTQNSFKFPILEKIKEAFVQAGVPETADFNTGKNNGVGYFDLNQYDGIRATTAKAFLLQEHRDNLDVCCGCSVGKLEFSKTKTSTTSTASGNNNNKLNCIGVSGNITTTGEQFKVKLTTSSSSNNNNSEAEVILCAGAIHSPTLLQVSGIGPSKVLDHLSGVEPLLINENIGRNLEDHLQIRPVYKIRENLKQYFPYAGVNGTTINRISRSPFGVARIGFDYLMNRSGCLALPPSQLCCFQHSNEEYKKQRPDDCNIEYHVQPLSLNSFSEPLHEFEGITMSVCNVNPTSTGSVTAMSSSSSSSSYQRNVSIVTNYLSTTEDQQVAIDSLKRVREVMNQPAMKEFEPTEFYGNNNNNNSDAELLQGARTFSSTIFHPVRTCAMGPDDDEEGKHSVVNSKLQVHGIGNLRIADASIMPCITSGNTAEPCHLIAEQCASFIFDKL